MNEAPSLPTALEYACAEVVREFQDAWSNAAIAAMSKLTVPDGMAELRCSLALEAVRRSHDARLTTRRAVDETAQDRGHRLYERRTFDKFGRAT